jgi:hypothetical protein
MGEEAPRRHRRHLAVGVAPVRVTTRWACDDRDARSACAGHFQAANPTCAIWTGVVSRGCRAIWLHRRRCFTRKPNEARFRRGAAPQFIFGPPISATTRTKARTLSRSTACRQISFGFCGDVPCQGRKVWGMSDIGELAVLSSAVRGAKG